MTSRLFAWLRLTLVGATLAMAPAARAETWLDWFNHAMFDFNTGLAARFEPVLSEGPAAAVPAWVKDGAANMLINLVNEPLTVGAYAIAGDGARSWHAAKRFAINTTFGYLGAVDRASEWNLPPDQTDIGLALCTWGMPAGPYVVLPFTGPRTLRDAVSDVGFANLLIYAALTPLVGFPPSVQAFAIVEILDIAATLAIARQIEGPPEAWRETSYDGVREAYLVQRQQRCSAVSPP